MACGDHIRANKVLKSWAGEIFAQVYRKNMIQT